MSTAMDGELNEVVAAEIQRIERIAAYPGMSDRVRCTNCGRDDMTIMWHPSKPGWYHCIDCHETFGPVSVDG